MKSLNLIKKYVPRHFRLGVNVPEDVDVCTQDVFEDVPVVDSSGCPVYSQKFIKSVPAVDNMSKYRVSQFRLSALVKAGVPLKVVNVNESKVASFEKLMSICGSIESAEAFIQKVENEKKERESWFMSPDVSSSESDTI